MLVCVCKFIGLCGAYPGYVNGWRAYGGKHATEIL